MNSKETKQPLNRRIASGDIRRQDVVRRLAELAFGKANDCVRLVLEPEADLKKLDLSLLEEVKRSEKGMVEIKLLNRLQALEQLTRLVGEEAADVESFLQALRGGEGG